MAYIGINFIFGDFIDVYFTYTAISALLSLWVFASMCIYVYFIDL